MFRNVFQRKVNPCNMLCRSLVYVKGNCNSGKNRIGSDFAETYKSGEVVLNSHVKCGSHGTTHEVPHHCLSESINVLVDFLGKVAPVIEILAVCIRDIGHEIGLVAFLMLKTDLRIADERLGGGLEVAYAERCDIHCPVIVAAGNGNEVLAVRDKLVLGVIAVHPVEFLHREILCIILVIEDVSASTLSRGQELKDIVFNLICRGINLSSLKKVVVEDGFRIYIHPV